jgi:hypothetical protein
VELIHRAMVDHGELLLNKGCDGTEYAGSLAAIIGRVRGHESSDDDFRALGTRIFDLEKQKGVVVGTRSPLFFLWRPGQKQVRSSPKLIGAPPPPSYF